MCRRGLIGGWVGKMHVFFVRWSTIWEQFIYWTNRRPAVRLNMIGLMSARNWACYVLCDQLMNVDFLGILSALCSIICNSSIVWTSYINTFVLLWTYEYDCILWALEIFVLHRRQNNAILTHGMRNDAEKNWIKVWIWLVVALGGTWH